MKIKNHIAIALYTIFFLIYQSVVYSMELQTPESSGELSRRFPFSESNLCQHIINNEQVAAHKIVAFKKKNQETLQVSTIITAIHSHNHHTLKMLLEAQIANINDVDHNGLTPTQHAVKHLNIQALQILAQHGANIDKKLYGFAMKCHEERLLWPQQKTHNDQLSFKDKTRQELIHFFARQMLYKKDEVL